MHTTHATHTALHALGKCSVHTYLSLMYVYKACFTYLFIWLSLPPDRGSDNSNRISVLDILSGVLPLRETNGFPTHINHMNNPNKQQSTLKYPLRTYYASIIPVIIMVCSISQSHYGYRNFGSGFV